MDPHGVEVLDGADDDHVVCGITHDLQFVLLPADDRLLDQDLVGGRRVDAGHGHLLVLFHVVGDPAAGPAQGEGGTDDRREADRLDDLHGLGVVVGQAGLGDGKADLLHGLLEQCPVLGLLDGRQFGTDQLHTELLQDPHLGHGDRRIERRLAAQGRQDRVGALLFYDHGQDLRRDRLDVGAVGEIGVSHDGGRVAVQQHDLVALFLQGLAGLGPGIVELTGLADDDRAGADDEDLVDVGSFRH